MSAPPPLPPQFDPERSKDAAYNIVSDLVIGVNTRRSDNAFQIKFMCVTLVLGTIVGITLSEDKRLGAIGGGVLGLIAGLFASGIWLMIYRAMKHFRGDHH